MEHERNLMGELNMLKEERIKPNFSDVSRRYGIDRHTVAKYWNDGDTAPADGRSAKRSAFDEHEEEIRYRAQLPGVTAKAIHEWLLDRHGGEGDQALPGYGAFTHWMRRHGIVVGESPAGDPEAHPRFETGPGEQLQFDWKEDMKLHDRTGALIVFNVFTATLCFSRLHVFLLAMRRTREVLLACMYQVLVRLGGTPKVWVTDHMSAYCGTTRDGHTHRDARVDRFAKDAGFEIALCGVRKCMTKGKDESANRFANRLRAYEGDFDGTDGLSEVIARVERRSNEEPNGTTKVPPFLLFQKKEKDALKPIGNLALLEQSLGQVTRQVVPSTMLVRARGREWSVPRRCIGHEVRTIIEPEGTLLVFDGDALVATHDTVGETRPIVYTQDHYLEALSDKRWGGTGDDPLEAARRNLEALDRLGGDLL